MLSPHASGPSEAPWDVWLSFEGLAWAGQSQHWPWPLVCRGSVCFWQQACPDGPVATCHLRMWHPLNNGADPHIKSSFPKKLLWGQQMREWQHTWGQQEFITGCLSHCLNTSVNIWTTAKSLLLTDCVIISWISNSLNGDDNCRNRSNMYVWKYLYQYKLSCCLESIIISWNKSQNHQN